VLVTKLSWWHLALAMHANPSLKQAQIVLITRTREYDVELGKRNSQGRRSGDSGLGCIGWGSCVA